MIIRADLMKREHIGVTALGEKAYGFHIQNLHTPLSRSVHLPKIYANVRWGENVEIVSERHSMILYRSFTIEYIAIKVESS